MSRMTHADAVIAFLRASEDALLDYILAYALRCGYTRYTSTLREAWRLSISGLTDSLCDTLSARGEIEELDPDREYTDDPATRFGVIEARKHRKRGISIGMFLGLMKYYRQSYLDLLSQSALTEDVIDWSLYYIRRFFDRVEVALVSEWVQNDTGQYVEELQEENRRIVTEKNKFLTLFESLASPCLFVNMDGRLDTINQAAASLFGVQAAPGTAYYGDIARPELPAWLHDEIELFLRGGQVTCSRQRGIPGEGPEKVVEVHLARVLDVSGKFSGVVVNITDMTEQANTELALRLSEARLMEAQQIAHIGYWESDLTQNTMALSEEAYRLFDLSIGSPVDRISTLSRVHPEDLLQYKTLLRHAIATGHKVETDLRYRLHDGHYRWLHIIAHPLRSSSGDINRLFGTMLDITERKTAEAALRDSETLFRGICASAHDGIILIDHHGDIQVWNAGAEQIFGYTEAEVLGRNLHTLIVPHEYREDHFRNFPTFQQHGVGSVLGKTLELVGLRKDGCEVPVELSVSALRREGGWHAIGIIRDITRRKATEDELLFTQRELEAAIIQANEMTLAAEAANKAKSQFLANMSHEIRTPMNGVIGMTSLLMQTELSPEQRDFAETIRGSADALLMLINDILDFSKIEADRLDLETVDFNLRDLLDDLLDIFALRAEEKSLELSAFLPSDVPMRLQGDPVRLRQILTNLVGNAIKFTAEGEVGIIINVDESNEDGALLRFSVKDTGIGIPADKQHLLFSSFSQVDASITRKFGGTGLGLSISRRLAELMGGSIGVESELGQGSTFWFTARLPVQTSSEDISETMPLEGIRVLGVDDNATNRRVLDSMLSAMGCRVTLVEDAVSALRQLDEAVEQNDPYRLALLDLQMPEVTGETLGMMIRQQPHLCDTRLIMLSSLGHRGEMARIIESGFAAYLLKPIKQVALCNTLARVLGATPILPEPAVPAPEPECSLAGLRILVAEDNPTNQKVAERMLAKLGYQADLVANGREAVEAMMRVAYDLVFMDVQMPEMDGLEATRAIRASSAVCNPQVPIIALTANAMQGDREICLEAGMTDYLSKPLQSSSLARMIELWVPAATREIVIIG